MKYSGFGGSLMKSNKGILTSTLLAIIALFTPINPSVAATVNLRHTEDAQTVIRSVTANDKVYLSYASSQGVSGVEQSLAHYSHRSHSSHSSHYSHKSHYSSY